VKKWNGIEINKLRNRIFLGREYLVFLLRNILVVKYIKIIKLTFHTIFKIIIF